MQFSFSFVAFVFLSAVAALPQDIPDQATPLLTAPAPKDTIYFIPTPAHVIAERNARNAQALASANSTSLAKRSVHCVANNVVTSDAVNVATYIQRLVVQCVQSNGGGSFCTQMACYNTACVDICGPFDDADACNDAGNGLLDVANSCQYGNGVTGGWCDGPTNINYGPLNFGIYHS
ncbi:hypothetical protein C8F04DRAFT_1172946 [Mycena alexandri]|uniref:Uncharacterized protein n=1 Tax=Mycena alexandri TaxID=1745969 RepID=A0AAD6XCC7_9AGAR|nr:hypothetical protein C8F04DRAFT_1172946 [Mycena alexandri]